jgi:hypothetical protein
MNRANPARFERCVKKVTRSLKKYRRPGNAFAICRASIPNAARRSMATRLTKAATELKKPNPILPLDIWTATMTPQILGGIEKQREKIERGMRRNGMFDFLTKKRVTYHAKIVRPKSDAKVSIYQGRAIYRTPEGDYFTSVDRDSRHDTLGDAKAFIREWKGNRGRKKNPPDFRFYKKALAADERFQRALEKEHGSRAGDVRYLTRSQSARIRKLGKAKERADAKWLAEMRKNPGKSNPEEAAKAFYEDFHGEPSKQLVKVRTPFHYHTWTGGIGKLIELVIKPERGGRVVHIKNFGVNQDGVPALLTANEKRNQLFIDGGDQSVNLKVFGITKPHEMEVLGKAKRVVYFTTKKHLRPEDGGTANYRHAFGGKKTHPFGRKKKNLPTVVYDVRNKLLSFAGGEYDIPDEGIDG